MHINIYNSKEELGKDAAEKAADVIRKNLQEKAETNIILATGASQFEMLNNLVQQPGIDWKRVRMFHLDEYAGLSDTHPASFRKYLQERFVDKVNGLKEVCFVRGDHPDLQEEIRRLNEKISTHPIDLACVGIGENGHLAFNDPPADFEVEDPFIVVELDEACRNQQFGEGWFNSMKDVPLKAISMSIKHILKSAHIICTVPDERKAPAVKNCLEGEITPQHPASILQKHPHCHVFLDSGSASLLTGTT